MTNVLSSNHIYFINIFLKKKRKKKAIANDDKLKFHAHGKLDSKNLQFTLLKLYVGQLIVKTYSFKHMKF